MTTLMEIYNNLAGFQYLILVPLVIIEGPIATVLAGFIMAQGFMNFFVAYPLIIIADLIGDILYYGLGRWGRNFGIRILRLNKEKISMVEKHFRNNSGKTILFSKIAHGIGTIFLFVAGMIHLPFKKFVFYNTIGSIPKSFILILIGFFFGQSYIKIGKYFDLFGLITLAVGIIILFFYLKLTKKIKQKEKEL